MASQAPEAGDRLAIPQAAVQPALARKPAVRRSSATTTHNAAAHKPTPTSKKSTAHATLAPKPAPKAGTVAKASHKRLGSAGGT
jgi:hypothetical protein